MWIPWNCACSCRESQRALMGFSVRFWPPKRLRAFAVEHEMWSSHNLEKSFWKCNEYGQREEVDRNKDDRQRKERDPVRKCLTQQRKRGLREVSIGILLCRLFSWTSCNICFCVRDDFCWRLFGNRCLVNFASSVLEKVPAAHKMSGVCMDSAWHLMVSLSFLGDPLCHGSPRFPHLDIMTGQSGDSLVQRW